MQQARPAAEDELREHDEDVVALGREIAQVTEKRIADVAIGRREHLERHACVPDSPLAPEHLRLVLVEGEVHGARVRQADGLGPVQRAHRGRVCTGDEDPHRERAPARALVHRRHVGHDDARLGQEPELERELERMPGLLGERSAAELLWDDDSYEVGFAARQPPDLVEHRVDRAALPVERLEQRRAGGEVEPAWADPGIGAMPGDVDRAESVGRDRPRESERAFGGRVELLDDEQGLVASSGNRRDSRRSRRQPMADPAVVAPHAEHRKDEHRDRDGDEPRALRELRPDHDRRDEAGRRRADGVHERAPTPTGSPRAQPVAHHPRLREREGGEDADHVQVEKRDHVRAEDPDQDRRRAGQDDDAVREDEAVAEVRELARREAVPGEQRREAREALERRVRGEHEDEQRRPLHGVVHEAAERAGPEDRAADLGDHRVRRARHRVHAHREVRDAEEHRNRERPEDGERLGGVLSLRVPKGVDPVRDRLDPGQRRGARGERAQQDEDADRPRTDGQRVRNDRAMDVSRHHLDETDSDEDEDRGHKRVRRERKQEPRLPHAAKVREHDHDEAGQRERDLVRAERGREGGDGVDPGRDRDRDREDVVGQERGRRDKAGRGAEVLPRNDVRAAARLVHAHGLAVGENDDPEQRRDPDRDRKDEMRRGRRDREEHHERRLRGVCDR